MVLLRADVSNSSIQVEKVVVTAANSLLRLSSKKKNEMVLTKKKHVFGAEDF